METAISGIADAIDYGSDGRPRAIIDWKSDVAPDAKLVDQYRAQLRAQGCSMLYTESEMQQVLTNCPAR